MDKFIIENMYLKEIRVFFDKIRTKHIIDSAVSLDCHFCKVDLDTLKSALEYCVSQRVVNTRFNKEERAFEIIAEQESEGIERMVYLILSGKPVEFTNFGIKLSFYKHFGEYRRLFRNNFDLSKFSLADCNIGPSRGSNKGIIATPVFRNTQEYVDEQELNKLLSDDQFQLITIELADIYLRMVYFNDNLSEDAIVLISRLGIFEQIFFFIQFGGYFSNKQINEFCSKIEVMQPRDTFIKYKMIVLEGLGEEEYYKEIGSMLLYAPMHNKMKWIKVLTEMSEENAKIYEKLDIKTGANKDNNINNKIDASSDESIDEYNFIFFNPELCALATLDLCFVTTIGIEKVYAEYLKLLELFRLRYQVRLNILYAWMRFFLMEGYIGLFSELVENVRDSPVFKENYQKRKCIHGTFQILQNSIFLKSMREFEFYVEICKYINGDDNEEKLRNILYNIEDNNSCSKYKLVEILQMYIMRRNMKIGEL